ncbi:MAG: reverse transcriptase family protein [Duncaniella sp.]|nr:reverse transcriptase family protein [Duncaniella sp.]
MSKIRNTTTRWELLSLLNEIKADLSSSSVYPFTIQKMMRLCNPKLSHICYKTFQIPKKSGGFREIYAPTGNLKWMQLCLNEIFKALYAPSPYAMGFAQGRSIVNNAERHLRQNYVFNIDLSDFFTSIDQARVWRRIQLPPFNFSKEVANIVAGLCSIEKVEFVDGKLKKSYHLPQGAPTSPLLTNAICDTLDRRLAGLAKRFGLRYSRYADDITFSSKHNVYQADSPFRKELEKIITGQNFRINHRKTRLHHRGQRQEVTGLTVGEKINVCRSYIKDIRAILHIWEKYGINDAIAKFYPRYMADKGCLNEGEPDIGKVISGKLCYLKMVKGESDPVYSRLREQFNRLTGRKSESDHIEICWEYLKTLPTKDFENQLGVKIEYAVSKRGRQYAYFMLGQEKIIVSISRNISFDNLPDNLYISLCRQVDYKVKYTGVERSQLDVIDRSTAYGRMMLGCPLPEDIAARYLYLIHRAIPSDKPTKYVRTSAADPEIKYLVNKLNVFMPGVLDFECR